MAKKTVTSRLVAGLSALGWVEGVPTTHYQRFQHADVSYHVFVGRSGALRIGNNGKVTETRVATNKFRSAVLGAAP